MIKSFLACTFILIQIACTKSKIKDQLPGSLQQLADKANCSCDPWINKYYWKAQEIYVLGYAGPSCNWIPVYFNADGTTVQMSASYTFNNFLEQAAFIEKSWSCGSK